MVLNEITEKLQIHACWKASLSKQLKFERIFVSSSNIVITKWNCSKSRSNSFYIWKYCHKKVTVPMALVNKCKKSYRELILKRGSVKMQVYGKNHFSNAHVFEDIFFFFARQCHPLTQQIIFQKHCFNGITHHNNLQVLYQKAMYEMMNLTNHSTLFHTIFYSKINGLL